jgi:hypothetical protein
MRFRTDSSPSFPAFMCLALLATSQALAADRDTSFQTRVLSIFTKAGCNAGACHGAAIGQGGFKLSLLGYDPEWDFDAITRQFAARRLDFASPSQSLILKKATHSIHHKGGERIEKDSPDYRTLLEWIAGGAPYGQKDLHVTAVQVSPNDVLADAPGQKVQLTVTATLSDGSVQNVTSHALYTANDDSIASIGDEGAIEILRRGATAVMVRYAGQVAAVRVATPLHDAPIGPHSFPPQNFIDTHVWDELSRMRVPPSALCDDDEFLRRVYLDLIGRLPSEGEVRNFLASPSTPASRQTVINRLLNRSEYSDLCALRLSDMLMIDSKRLGEEPARAYHAWLRDQIAQNVPFDRMVKTLLTSHGDFSQSPPANFYRLARDPRDTGEFVSATFLGAQIACARCHAHPFAAWTQADFYSFAALFSDLRQTGSQISGGGPDELTDPKTGSQVVPRLLGTREPVATKSDRRVALADWLTSPQNPYFARAIVNRVWRHLVGPGIVEPVDDLRVTNPPSNPGLLDALAADFVASGFDLRHLVRTIVESRTYQLSSHTTEANQDDQGLFSHAFLKPLPAQVLADAIADATDVPDTYPGYPSGTRAVQLVDSRTPSYSLDVLGRCTRDLACDGRPRAGGMSKALHLINGSTINDKLHGGIVDHLLAAHSSPDQKIDELYLRTMSRFPNKAEREFCVTQFARAKDSDKPAVIQDLLWALLNSREFAYNH